MSNEHARDEREALSDERLTAIRAMIALTDVGDAQYRAITDLLRDDDLLRAELATARERITEARSILRVVANAEALSNHRAEVWARAGDWMLLDKLYEERRGEKSE